MRKQTFYSVLLAILLLHSVGAKSQNTFSRIFPVDTLPDGQSGMCMNLLDDGYLITGSYGDADAALYKTDFQGRLIWKKKYSFEISSSNGEMTLVRNGKIYTFGPQYIDSVGVAGTYIACLDLNGNILWTKTYRKTKFEEYAQAVVDDGKNFLVCSFRINIDTPRKQELLVYKMDTLGNVLQETSISQLAKGYKFWTNARFRDNKYYLSYGYNSFGNSGSTSFQDAGTVILDSSLNILKKKIFLSRGTNEEGFACFLPLKNKRSLYVWLKDTARGTVPIVVMSPVNTVLYFLDSNNVEEKRIALFDFCPKTLYNIKELANGDIVGIGNKELGCWGGTQLGDKGWVFRMSQTGQIKWERFIQDSIFGYYPIFYDFEEDKQGNIIISGGIIRHNMTHMSVWLVKLDSNGCLHPRCDSSEIRVSSPFIENTESKVKIYPNPAYTQLNIDYEPIGNETEADIQIVDLLGKAIWQRKMSLQTRPLSINVSDLPSGMYNVIFSVVGQRQTVQKMVILR